MTDPQPPRTQPVNYGILFDLICLAAIGYGAYQMWGFFACVFTLGVACYWRRPI